MTAIAMAAAGCSGGESSDSRSDSPEPGDGLTAESALGDLRTIDVCGLVDPNGFADYGTFSTSHDSSILEFDVCSATIETGAADSAVRVDLGRLGRLDDRPEAAANEIAELDNGLWIGREKTDSSCTHTLVFADDTTMNVIVRDESGEPSVDRCAVADTAMDMVTESVANDAVPHRNPDQESLQLLDSCELGSETSITGATTLESAEPTGYPARHTCVWSDDPEEWGDTYVLLHLGFGPEPESKGAGTSESTIAGRSTVTTQVRNGSGPGMAYCTAETPRLPYDGVEDASGAVEIAEVRVADPEADSDEAVCAQAERVAEHIWPELPGT